MNWIENKITIKNIIVIMPGTKLLLSLNNYE